MQIHELNLYSGELNTDAYVAVDNGTDTGKVPVPNLTKETREEMNDLSNALNARIDNIIAGGDAPSEAEIIDARLGAAVLGSVPYGSLGSATRGQATALFGGISNAGNVPLGLVWESGSVDGNGEPVNNGTRIRTKQFSVADYERIKVIPPSDGKVAFELYSSESTFIGEIPFVTTETLQTMGANVNFLRLLVGKTNNASITIDYGVNVSAFGVTHMGETLQNESLHIDNLDYQNNAIYGFKAVDSFDYELGSASFSASAITYSEDLRRVRTKSSSTINVKKGDYIYLTDYSDARFTLSVKYADSSYEVPSPVWITSGGYYIKHDGELNLLITRLTEVVQSSVLELLSLLRIEEPSMSIVSESPENWQLGTTDANGIVDKSVIRIVSNMFHAKKGTILSTLWDGDYDFTFVQYDDSFAYVSAVGWTKIHHVAADCICRVLMRKKTNGTISEGEISSIAADLQIVVNPTNYYYLHRDEAIKAINHTGWYTAPTNTIPAFVESYEHGFKYIETDVNFTSDGVCVCLHNTLINDTARNPDGSEIEEEISINDITYAQALEYDFGIYMGQEYAGTKLPTLAEVLDLCKALDMQAYIDFKTSPLLTKAEIENVVDIVENCGMKNRVVYIPGVPDYGHYIIRKDPKATIGYTYTTSETHVLIATSMLTGENAVFLNANYSLIDSAGVARCKSYGLPLEAYTIESTADIDAMDDYITGVTSGSINVNEYLKSKYIN